MVPVETKETNMSFKKTQTAKSTEPGKPPVAKVRVGLITGSVWERSSENGTFYAVTFERRYRDAEGQWQTSHSYDTGDLLALAKAADLAHTRILEAQEAGDAE
jgi:hypothetical protein